MKKILLLLLAILVLGFASEHAAFAGLGLYEIHHSRANIVSGIVDYTSARFSRLEIFVASNDADVKENHLHSTGTLKFSSGIYSYWDGLNLVDNVGEARTLKLALGNNITQTGTHQSIKFIPVNDAGEQVYFYGNADSGLNAVETVWRMNNAKDFNGYMNLPNIRSTSEQLSTFVPYIEYIFVESDDSSEGENSEENTDEDSNSDSESEDADSENENSDENTDEDADSESEDESTDSDSESEDADSENENSDENTDEDADYASESEDDDADSESENSDYASKSEDDDADSENEISDENTDEDPDYDSESEDEDADSESEVLRVRRTAKNNVKRVKLSELARRADEADEEYDSENVTGLTMMKGFNFSVTNSHNNGTPVTLPTNVTLTIEDMYTIYGESVALENITASAKTGEVISGSVEFGSEIPVDVIAFITVRLDVLEDGRTNSYKWRFHSNELSGTTSLSTSHVSAARFKNNASIYKGAKFKGLYLTLNNPTRVIDSKYITTGLIDIPAGGYTLCDASNSKRISKVAEGTLRTLPLIPQTSLIDRNFGAEYFLGSDSNKRYKIILGGDVEENLNGQIVTWTFPNNLNMDGSATIPNYTTTSEQLEEFVPYVETVSSDNNAISALSYRIVDRYDTITPISPDFRVDFKLAVYVNDVMAYESEWLTESCEGAVEFGSSFALNNVTCISVMLRTFENKALPCTYQWNFTNKRSSGSGDTEEFEGCNLNFGFTGIFTLMAFALIYSGEKFRRVKK